MNFNQDILVSPARSLGKLHSEHHTNPINTTPGLPSNAWCYDHCVMRRVFWTLRFDPDTIVACLSVHTQVNPETTTAIFMRF
jgi:hypothetical protein